jgi:hypothetical protein
MKKVTLNPEDYQKIVNYIVSMAVPFQRANEAAEIGKILNEAVIMEIEQKEDKTKK